ncbi:MAG: glycosyltransferase [Gammaproteobacteria bacterium]|nr:glycosyltransferase [Gammaproteobacteria bacterium]
MSVFNGEDTIANSIDSILAQTFDDWELIIIDDCSTDSSALIIREYENSDRRIKMLVNQVNMGLAAGLNRGIKASSGTYIARIDADDLSFPDRLKKQVLFLDKNPDISVLGTGAQFINEGGHVIKEVLMPKTHDEIIEFIPKSSPFIHASVIARRKFFIETGGYNCQLRRAQDYELWARGMRSFKYHNLPEILVKYQLSNRQYKLSSILYGVMARVKSGYRRGFFIKAVYWSVIELMRVIIKR